MYPFHANPLFNAQFMRSIGYGVFKGAELGECLALIQKIKADDFKIWHDLWLELAQETVNLAQDYETNDHRQSAFQAYLRASNYFRSAFCFLDETPGDPKLHHAYQHSKTSFRKALDCSDIQYIALEIPYENTFMPAYLYIPKQARAQSPLLIDTGGGDGQKEESYFYSAQAAMERGYYCLNFDGPGQGAMLREQGIAFRYDWEAVIAAVIDHMESLKAYTFSKHYVLGISFGGYLASRAACFEKRLNGCIVDPGILNSMASAVSQWPERVIEAIKNQDKTQVDAFLNQLKSENPQAYFMLSLRKTRFGAGTLFELLQHSLKFHIEDCVQQIQCPMLVFDNDREHISAGQAKALYEAITSKKVYHLFSDDKGHGGHCQPMSRGLSSEVMFNWLDEQNL